jgi:hypothetical protein
MMTRILATAATAAALLAGAATTASADPTPPPPPIPGLPGIPGLPNPHLCPLQGTQQSVVCFGDITQVPNPGAPPPGTP